MADETRVAAGKRFSRDLRLIREDRGVSIDDIHRDTRIARTLIESFEEGGLYDHDTFNEVYLRSFVRAYAEAVEISPETVRAQLAAALEGTYENALAEQYLASPEAENARDSSDDGNMSEEQTSDSSSTPDRPPTQDDTTSTPDPPMAGGPDGRGGIVGPARALDEDADEEGDDEEDAAPPSREDPEEKSTEEEEGEEVDREELRSSPPKGQPSSAEVSDSAETSEDDVSSEGESDDSDGLSSDRRPSWMEEGGEEESSAPPRDDDAHAGGEPSNEADDPLPPDGGIAETGIVGEPTAMGSESAGDLPGSAPSTAPSSAAPGRDRRPTGWRRWVQGDRRELMWAGIGFIVVLFVLVGLGIAFFSTDTGTDPQERATASTAPAPDTAAAPADTTDADTTAQDRPPPADVTLGDDIPITVLATRNVRGIRIQRDEDLPRPYWIQEGEAAVFPFQERATLQEELGDVQLFIAGYPYPESRWDTTGQVVITRAEVEAFVDTLRGAPAALTVTPDTIPKGPPNQ